MTLYLYLKGEQPITYNFASFLLLFTPILVPKVEIGLLIVSLFSGSEGKKPCEISKYSGL